MNATALKVIRLEEFASLSLDELRALSGSTVVIDQDRVLFAVSTGADMLELLRERVVRRFACNPDALKQIADRLDEAVVDFDDPE